MYFYSLVMFALIIGLAPHMHRQSPLAALSFSYLYLLDTIVSGLYTALFGVTWFLVLASSAAAATGATGVHGGPAAIAGAAAAMDKQAGFTSPAVNASRVDVVAAPAAAIIDGQDAVAVATASPGGALGLRATSAGGLLLQPESATSIALICLFWLVRWYLTAIVFAYARVLVRESASPAEAPFEGNNGGQGWKGRLGRGLIGVARGYWEGGEGWQTLNRKFRRSGRRGHSRNISQASSMLSEV